jgi:SAP domain-containing new25
MDTKSKKELQDVARVLNIYAGGEREEVEERLQNEFLCDVSSRTKRELQDVATVLGIYAGGSKNELEERIAEELVVDEPDVAM